MLESGKTADLSILVSADLRQRPVGKGERGDQVEPGKTAGTRGKPQYLPRGEQGPAGARGNS